MSAKLYRPLELLRRIQSEHQDDYVYRGENRTFSAPLWPKKYRAVFRSEAGLKLDPQLTVRGCGRQFFFMSKFLRPKSGNKDTHRYEQYVKLEKLRLECMSKIRNALGYVLSEAMFQQAGRFVGYFAKERVENFTPLWKYISRQSGGTA